ncbi:DnaJ domain-containing protein [Salinibius halmophilus]|uniref:DnaJ domain-containing protein n=1 Tax=Salinibius halmophilus TaxID=1853216 RepID=UPI000E6766E7|nr:DnaJ domain-containing protein [Salinibius halmophilus]
MNRSFIRASAKFLGGAIGKKKRQVKQAAQTVAVAAQFRSPLFVETLFATMGHLAVADGRVNEYEIAFARDLMKRLQLTDPQTEKAMLAFNQGKVADWPMLNKLTELHQRYQDKQWIAHCFVEWQIRFCLTDGSLQSLERVQLARIAQVLNINQVQFASLLSKAQPKRRVPQATTSIKDDLAVFKLTTQAKWQDVKGAYRRLISQYHPDKHPSDEQKAKHINAAYTRLDKHWRQYRTFQ